MCFARDIFWRLPLRREVSSALMFYNLVLILIYLVEVLILKFLLPMIHVYIMVQVMNYMLGEDLLTELGELLKKLILWILKTLLALVVGINVVQGLLGPAIDGLKRSAVTKTVEAIPGDRKYIRQYDRRCTWDNRADQKRDRNGRGGDPARRMSRPGCPDGSPYFFL